MTVNAGVLQSLRIGGVRRTAIGATQQGGSCMSRKAGDRYTCEKCGAVLVYEKECPCPPGKAHSEICCDQQMTEVPAK